MIMLWYLPSISAQRRRDPSLTNPDLFIWSLIQAFLLSVCAWMRSNPSFVKPLFIISRTAKDPRPRLRYASSAM